MAYTPFDTSKPAGTQTGPLFQASANANDDALFDMIGSMLMQGHAFSQSGGTAEEPTTLLFTNGTRILKLALTWVSGNIVTLTPSLSINTGSTYDPIGSAATFTYDGSGNMTASTNFGGLFLKMLEWTGKIKAMRNSVNANTVAIGLLGTMSTQAANAVAITGGSVSCTYEREAVITLSNGNASNTLNWQAGGLATLTVTGASASITHSNLPNGVAGYMTVKVVNGGLATALLSGLKWAGGTPQAFSVTGTDFIVLECNDGATVYAVGFLKGMA